MLHNIESASDLNRILSTLFDPSLKYRTVLGFLIIENVKPIEIQADTCFLEAIYQSKKVMLRNLNIKSDDNYKYSRKSYLEEITLENVSESCAFVMSRIQCKTMRIRNSKLIMPDMVKLSGRS